MVSTSSVAGIVSGRNPLEYVSSSPYTLFLFQAVFILFLCQVLHWPLRKLQQPKVIAEVVAGILLGPTVLGRIPNFTETVFPEESIPGMTLIANVGIIMFLFIVGLEVDLHYIKKNLKVAVSVGLINMAIPFGLGCAISVGLYNEYRTDPGMESIEFTTYMVFVAVALCITAFPVLARILVELNLIGDRVGTIVLAAGIMNDLTGWILLALVVTLSNADNGINTLYILLLTLAWFLLLAFPVRLALRWYLKRFTNELATGEPSQLSMVIIIAMVFISAFYTDIIGVHPIFGAFMVGVLVPRDNGYVIKITEKLEDMVHIVMIPIYFALAGLNVNLGDLDRGIDWAYVVGVISLAMIGKVAGGLIAAKMNGLFWRESLTVGVLMSCKGIVEIVVLNVGLNANIISRRVYSMFIVMTLVTTFLTTPLTLLSYPVSYRESVARHRGAIKKDTDTEGELLGSPSELSIKNLYRFKITDILLLLRKIDTLPHVLALLKDLTYDDFDYDVKAIHLRAFSSRTSHLLEASSAAPETFESSPTDLTNSQSILSIVKAFSSMLDVHFSSKSILASQRNYATAINDHITGPANLLLTSYTVKSILDLTEEENDFDMSYRYILENCECHMAILLTTEPTRTDRESTVRMVLEHDNFMSSTDLLSLYLVAQLAKVHRNVHIYVRSNMTGTKDLEEQFDEYVKSSGPDVSLSVSHFREFSDISGEVKHDPALAGDVFVVSHEYLESEVRDELLRFTMREEVELLAVKAATSG
ncbi:hypothetical protein FT663_00165 [Candidozyma haemuli var. vulneris]|uniref:Cation/H+ exchanger transmembrane domain-containing protein n=1 Tax=Candidozyma haemuli TaxID=45357 RepID=A0A2V1ALV7_9ASCO|nr:hypothetical protein CXQ85_001043 [[Candida] haemuloni]KAF3994195.1 hypothetical protein FT662_00064 [[Candida] haemuloni var. vulneris]KAF3995743.1 hypothetical protein FT663_00165 [[Candida] haemuloni var. vulneris]PVH18755.1 hypothetical protein CXQ85_001043 [[Candida] haemuloni]